MASIHAHNLDFRCKQTFEIILFAAVVQRDTVHYTPYTPVMKAFECLERFLKLPQISQTTLDGYFSSGEQVDDTSG